MLQLQSVLFLLRLSYALLWTYTQTVGDRRQVCVAGRLMSTGQQGSSAWSIACNYIASQLHSEFANKQLFVINNFWKFSEKCTFCGKYFLNVFHICKKSTEDN